MRHIVQTIAFLSLFSADSAPDCQGQECSFQVPSLLQSKHKAAGKFVASEEQQASLATQTKDDYDDEITLVPSDEAGVLMGNPAKKFWRTDAVQEEEKGAVVRPLAEFSESLLQADAATARPANANDIEAFVTMHNLYRCMHGVPEVIWSDAVAADAYNYIKSKTSMKHSQSYDIAAPAGPAGENLAWSSAGLSAADAVTMWYHEVNDCVGGPDDFTDGCPEGVDGKAVGHFTALIWKGVKEIGCAFSDSTPSPTLIICRYKAGDSLSLDTPNMNKPSNYPNHVFARHVAEEKCDGGDSGSSETPEADDAPVGECKASCSSNKKSWAKKCKQTKCEGCSACSSAGSGDAGEGSSEPGKKPAGACKPSCSKSRKPWSKKCKQKKCKGCSDCTSDGNGDAGKEPASEEGDPVAATPAPTKKTTQAPAAGKCLISDPDWQCTGANCVPKDEYQYYSTAGGSWCLTNESPYCQREDASWCGGSCACPGYCPHACGRCPPPNSDGANQAATTTTATKAAAPASGSFQCKYEDPNWDCTGYQCVPKDQYMYYSAAGGKWCLGPSSSYCQKTDASWCGGECKCPGSCPNACGRCP